MSLTLILAYSIFVNIGLLKCNKVSPLQLLTATHLISIPPALISLNLSFSCAVALGKVLTGNNISLGSK